MVVLEISAQDIQNMLNDLEQQFEIVERLEFFRGKLFFSISSISGCLEIHPSEKSVVFSVPLSSLIMEHPIIQSAWAFNPKWVLEFARNSILETLGIPKSQIVIHKTKESIDIHVMNEFIWEKLDLKFLPRKLILTNIKINENGIRLEFDLTKKR